MKLRILNFQNIKEAYCTLLKTKSIKKVDFENTESAAQFPFPQPPNTFLVSNATPLIDFSLKMLATGRVEPTIRIFVVTQPLNFLVFNWV